MKEAGVNLSNDTIKRVIDIGQSSTR